MMARPFKKEVAEFGKGAVVADTTAATIPDNAASRARNVAWLKAGFPSKRKGVSTVSTVSQSGQHPILGGGNALGMNWTIDDLGRWSKISAGAFSAIDAGNTTPFTAGTHYPSTAVAHSLLFAVNGIDAKKTNGTTVSAFGFAAPAAPTVTDSGVAGNPTGTYLIGLTAYNENTGHESSLSAVSSVTVAGKKIHVAWVFPADPQITKIRVHIFKNALSSTFFRTGSVDVSVVPDATTGGYPSGTLAIDINFTDADINNLITKSPDQFENNPPPANLNYIAFSGGRMFATDGKFLYFSKLDDPESFDPRKNEVVNTGDNQTVIAFVPLSDQQLLVLKSGSTWALIGPSDPNTWDLQILDPAVGITSARSLALTEGGIWWEGSQGFFRLQYSSAMGIVGKPVRMDAPAISDRVEALSEAQASITVSAYDALHQRLFFAVAGATDTRNTGILPWNNKLSVWEDTWDPMDVSSLFVMVDSGTNQAFVAIGNYAGRVFKLWDLPYVDGVRQTNGATLFTLDGNVSSADLTHLTDTTATFDTANDGLKEIPVVAVSAGGVTSRNIIASNTGTVLTLRSNWTITPDLTWTYHIGSPNFEFDTKHFHPTSVPGQEGSEFYSRNFKRCLVRGATDTGQSQLDVYTLVDGNVNTFAVHVVVPIASGGAKFDIDTWDLSKFGSDQITTSHRSLGTRGRTCGLRIVNRMSGQGVILLAVGLYGTEHGYKA